MGRKWMWFTLVVALLLFISLEAATADGNGGGGGKGNGADDGNKGEENNGNGKGNEGDNGNGKGNGADNGNKGDENNGNHNGNGNGNQDGNGNGKGNGDDNGNKGGKDNGNGKGNEGGNGNGKGNGDDDGNKGGKDNGNEKGNEGGNGNGKGNGDGNGNKGGDDNGNGKGNQEGNGGNQSPPPTPYYPPPSHTPPYYPPPSSTPPSSTPPSSTPPSSTPPSSTPPPSTPPSSTPPSSTPPSQTPPPSTPPSQTPPSSTPPSQTPPSSTPPSNPPPSSTPPSNPPPTTPSPPQGDSTDYYMVSPVERTGQERAYCAAYGACYHRTLTCPAECPHRRPGNNKMKGCFVDCSSKCEATCKWRKPNCDNYGSLCYDPRFVGGDGSMFYFHGSKGSDFAIISDDKLQINAHFIGTRPMGRTRDFTWVQALSIIFDSHTLVLAAKRVSKWDDKVESLIVKWDGEMINIPTDGEAEWRIKTEENRVVIVERTDDLNTVRATVSGLAQVDTRVVPIGEHENKVHHYQIPSDDAFAHLETQFKFFKLSSSVEGVLGRTYQPGFESPVKMGVAMPMMGGEDKYQTPSLTSPLCRACKFQRPSSSSSIAMVTTAAM